MPAALRFGPNANLLVLQVSATLATLAAFREGIRGLGLAASALQLVLWLLGMYLRESSYDLVNLQLVACGVVYGLARLRARVRASGTSSPPLAFPTDDVAIFLVGFAAAALVSHWAFGGFIFNGDEVAMSYQADVYGHLRAYAPVPPCPNMFENYWVFRHEGRVFSQYTPGWPMFMAPFQRLGVIWLAGPTMGGIVAVGAARLSRRLAWGLGETPETTNAIARIAGPIGAVAVLLGPSALLNAGSRFSHTMVCACFAWAVEAACVITDRDVSNRRAWGYGLVLGSATALGLATRPADGGFIGIGIFVYFVWALLRRRVGWRALAGTTLAFLLFAGLTLIVLRLQVGEWFKTGYSITASVRSEGKFYMSAPLPHELRIHIPLAVGSYVWWPAALALGLAAHVQAIGGREPRVSLMLMTSAVALLAFYTFVPFGRWSYDGLGPRYELPVVVMAAPGTAALLAPLLARAIAALRGFELPSLRLRWVFPAALAAVAVVGGTLVLAPFVHPLARDENVRATAPLRAAAKLGLKNAIVILEPGKLPADWWNLAQNAPFAVNPDVLFLARRSDADEACARKEFPGRRWYRAGFTETLTPYP
jgi:hypothetical protein